MNRIPLPLNSLKEGALLSALNVQIGILDELRQTLEKEVQALKSYSLGVARRREANTLIPISRLPLEVLAVIFDWTCRVDLARGVFDVNVVKYDQMRMQRFSLMATCSRWRGVAIGHGALWAHIMISHSAAVNYPRQLSRSDFWNTFSWQIQRAGPRLHSLWIRWRSRGSLSEELWTRTWSYVMPHLQKCPTIYLDLELRRYPPILTLQRLPLLQSLYYIQPRRQDGHEACLNGFPSLRTLWIEGARGVLRWFKRARLSLSNDVALNLTSLSIVGMISGSTAILCCIKLCRNLVALQWESTNTDYTGGQWIPELLDPVHMDRFLSITISLPKLRYLWLGENYAVRHMRWFVCPMLETLVLRGCNLSGVKLNHDEESWDFRFPNLTRICADLHEYTYSTLVSSEFAVSHSTVKEVHLLTEVLDVEIAHWFSAVDDSGMPNWPSLELLALDADFLSEVNYVGADTLIASVISRDLPEKPFVLRVIAEPDDFIVDPRGATWIPFINHHYPQHLQFTPLGDPVRDWYQLWRDIVHNI